MLVKSQDGELVLNNEMVTAYCVSDKWDSCWKVLAKYGNDNQAVIGRYSTREKCKAALGMLLECQTMNHLLEMYKDFNARDLCCEYVADQPIGVFEMPEEDEI